MGGGGGVDLYKEDGKSRCLFYSCKYSDFWRYLGCSGYEADTLSRQDLVGVAREKKNVNSILIIMISIRGQKSLS